MKLTKNDWSLPVNLGSIYNGARSFYFTRKVWESTKMPTSRSTNYQLIHSGHRNHSQLHCTTLRIGKSYGKTFLPHSFNRNSQIIFILLKR